MSKRGRPPGSSPRYKVRSVKDDIIFDDVKAVGEYYGMTKDAIYYRLDKPADYHDGLNFERVFDNTEALESTKAVQSAPFVEKYGDKTVPLPGYEDKYTISTSGVITNVQGHNTVVKVKTRVEIRNTVVLHKGNKTQVHNVENLMKKAFGDPTEEQEID